MGKETCDVVCCVIRIKLQQKDGAFLAEFTKRGKACIEWEDRSRCSILPQKRKLTFTVFR